MNKTIPHELNRLPDSIESQLAALKTKHQRHQDMLERHKELKARRRERHRDKWHRISLPPIVLI
ncbi:MAG: hypothetical protein LLG20_22780 [Acidobacteriales bacterium]|nr:hypothetical protein [Terriglobales bacterium]